MNSNIATALLRLIRSVFYLDIESICLNFAAESRLQRLYDLDILRQKTLKPFKMEINRIKSLLKPRH